MADLGGMSNEAKAATVLLRDQVDMSWLTQLLKRAPATVRHRAEEMLGGV